MAVVIYHPEQGVYLGSCMGLGFWSKLDPIGQPSACTFDNAEQAQAHMQSWDNGPIEGATFVEVEPDDGSYASIAACAKAGLPPWIISESPTANSVPA